MYNRRIAVRGIIYKRGKLFVQKLKNNGVENNFWSTPGGGLDGGESLIAGLHREIIEETGIVPNIGHLLLVQQFYDGEKEQLEFFFHIKNSSDYERIDLTTTSHGELEVSQFGFVDPKKEKILPLRLCTIDFEPHLHNPTPVHIINELLV